MGNLTMSGFIIGILLLSLLAITTTVMMSQLNNEYETEYVGTSMYNNLNQTNELIQELDNKSQGFQTGFAPIDAASQLVAGGISTIKIGRNSLDTFDSIKNNALNQTKVGNGQIGSAISVTIGAIILLIFVMVFIVTPILKWYI